MQESNGPAARLLEEWQRFRWKSNRMASPPGCHPVWRKISNSHAHVNYIISALHQLVFIRVNSWPKKVLAKSSRGILALPTHVEKRTSALFPPAGRLALEQSPDCATNRFKRRPIRAGDSRPRGFSFCRYFEFRQSLFASCSRSGCAEEKHHRRLSQRRRPPGENRIRGRRNPGHLF